MSGQKDGDLSPYPVPVPIGGGAETGADGADPPPPPLQVRTDRHALDEMDRWGL